MRILGFVIGWVAYEVLSKFIGIAISTPLVLMGILDTESSVTEFATKMMVLNGLSSFLGFISAVGLVLAIESRRQKSLG